MNGGDRVAEVLKAQGVEFLFTLCGGHISPILVGAKARGIRIVDTRHEVTAVFAADAVARLTGVPGVAAVTAGPGVTNTITAIKNAQMAQSPLVLIGGAAPTALKGRGALQDIDQMSVVASIVKWSKAVKKVRDLAPAIERAFIEAQSGVPGPVFVECPIDLLYDEALIRDWYGGASGGRSLSARVVNGYLKWHVNRMFAGADTPYTPKKITVSPEQPDAAKVAKVAEQLKQAKRPVMLVGSQATLDAPHISEIADAVGKIGVPVYLSGMARGLLGQDHLLQMRHKRGEALKAADLVILAGVPCDFRLDYGRHIPRRATYVSANRSKTDLNKNRRPDIGLQGDPGLFLRYLSELTDDEPRWADWQAELTARDDARNAEIDAQAEVPAEPLNPVKLCQAIEGALNKDTILVADGGDFVGTASYVLSPRGPLTWLDPGPFGTLGVGAGFALGAKLCRPDADVWIIYGDGSVGYSLTEFDTFARHDLPVIAVVGNDAGWSQIAREQIEILKDDVGTVLERTDYHKAAEAYGGRGFLLDDPAETEQVLSQAKTLNAKEPVLINAHIGKTDFRKGSISM